MGQKSRSFFLKIGTICSFSIFTILATNILNSCTSREYDLTLNVREGVIFQPGRDYTKSSGEISINFEYYRFFGCDVKAEYNIKTLYDSDVISDSTSYAQARISGSQTSSEQSDDETYTSSLSLSIQPGATFGKHTIHGFYVIHEAIVSFYDSVPDSADDSEILELRKKFRIEKYTRLFKFSINIEAN
ncbi:MAG: hypothetical protein LBV22_02825 [Mycoplasmataceae bacterium]|jgi:hypothetical protein|nr:hypothetical protein [Mycoplasmataceae bacterium]